MFDLDKIPPPPRIAHELLRLRNSPDATVTALAELVEQEPGLAAQVIRYANSPFYARRRAVEDIHDAIAWVLGFDQVLNMALGMIVARGHPLPLQGAISRERFWRHAVYSAAVMRVLTPLVDFAATPSSGLLYLAGLLHNYGYLVAASRHPEQILALNAAIQARLDQAPAGGEPAQVDDLLCGHDRLAAQVFSAWGFPDTLVRSIQDHHQTDSDTDAGRLAQLLRLVDHVLAARGITLDVYDPTLPADLLARLRLDEDAVWQAVDPLFSTADELDQLSAQLVA